MSRTLPRTEESIFSEALELPVAAREAFLAAACQGDAALVARVRGLLQSHTGAGGFLQEPLAATADQPPPERPGTIIGPYKLLQQIGEGGMGVVYMAEQEQPVRRRVALKIIKPGMDSRQVIARFEAERQALAMMDHVNIAKVLDAGTVGEGNRGQETGNRGDSVSLSPVSCPLSPSAGRPYFVMELVHGVPLTKFCDDNRLTLRERLELFVPVCHAIQHAHQKGIIHRDIKPSNILVTMYDDRPVPKVIDFGVAKAIEQRLTERTLFTQYGMLVGTFEYMSPEQAEMNAFGVDTRSDIYSLGVLLYELLTGTTPLEGRRIRQEAFVEVVRLIKEEEPPRPSIRLSSTGSLPKVAAACRTEPARLAQLLRGELDWIVMKCLEKDRSRRYETANGLARDVERYLHDEAVEACPPSAAYRLRKFASRYRAALTTATLVAASLLAGIVASTLLAWQARNSQMQAEWNRQAAVHEEQQAQTARLAEAAARKGAEAERDKAARLNQTLESVLRDQRRTIYAAELNLVRLEAQRGSLPRMRELLMRQIPGLDQEDLRGFEWNYWYRFLHRAQELRRFDDLAVAAGTDRVVMVPGGQLVAVARGNQTQLVEVATANVRYTAPTRLTWGVNRNPLTAAGHLVAGGAVSGTAFLPSANSQPVAEFDVWDPQGSRRTIKLPEDSLSHLSFLTISSDGRFVAALGNDSTHTRANPLCRLLTWNAATGELQLNQTLSGEFNRVRFTDDAAQLVAHLCHGSRRAENDLREVITVLDRASGKRLATCRHDDEADSVFLLPGGKGLLFGTLGWSGRNRKELYRWSMRDESPQRLGLEYMPDYMQGAVSPDGSLLAISGHTVSTVRLIDTNLGLVVSTLHNEASTIDSLTFSPDGRRLLACDTAGVVLAWDLNHDQDLFKLRANPLGPLTGSGYALADDHSLLAIATAQDGVRLRRRDGHETILRQDEPTARRGGSVRLRFSPDRRWLACETGADYASASPGGVMIVGRALRMFDTLTGMELWTVRLPEYRSLAPPPPVNYGVPDFLPAEQWAFAADGSRLAVIRGEQLHGIDAATGRILPTPVTLSEGPRWLRRQLVRHSASGQILLAALEPAAGGSVVVRLLDAISGVALGETRVPGAERIDEAVASPDGRHVGLVRGETQRVEVWEVSAGRLVLQTRGRHLVFSGDGGKVAALGVIAKTVAGVARPLERVDQASLWEVATGRQLATISLAGNGGEEVRFSPDGRRLLTLHGKLHLGAGGAVPEGRLWDVLSGREMMTLPVADVNHYLWDLAFDPSGTRLTSLVLVKALGNAGGMGATVYDAAPLSEAEDALLLARPLVAELFGQYPLVSEVVAALEANPRLRPAVRQAALSLASQRTDDPQAIAAAASGLVSIHNPTADEAARALRWAHAVQRLLPRDPRSTVLMGAAQFRAGKLEAALATLQAELRGDAATEASSLAKLKVLRRAFRVLVLVRQQRSEPAQSEVVLMLRDLRRIVRFTSDQDLSAAIGPSTDLAVAGEALATLNQLSGSPLLFNQSPQVAARHMIAVIDANDDGRLTSADNPDDWAELQVFDANRDNEVTAAEFAVSFAEARFPSADPARQVEMLTRFIERSPKIANLYVQRAGVYRTQREYHKALQDVKVALDFNPQDAATYNLRSQVQICLGDLEAALDDCNRSIALNAKYASPFHNRGLIHRLQGRLDAALADLNESLQLSRSAATLVVRGDVRRVQGRYQEALRDFDDALALEDKSHYAYAAKARLRATCPVESFRDAKQALADGLKACELSKWDDGDALDALAAAYANSGDFAQAASYQEKAIPLAIAPRRADYEARLALYRAGQPFREGPSP
jgi:serine/threonine protein kinase/tetratricopeptide (TPR) repeat protein/WD40 repeat protein